MSRIGNKVVELVRSSFSHGLSRKGLLASAAAAALAAGIMPATAQAGHRDDYRDRDRRVDVNIRIGERHPEPACEERRVRVWVPAVYRTVCDRRWVEPVYRTVPDRRWVEPVYRTECERVWVPDVYETREVRFRDRYGCWVTRRERVLVCAGHYDSRERRVCVAEGHYENCDRQELVCAGHWDNVERQELVCEGHYEVRTERVRVAERTSPVEVINPMLGGLGVRVGR